MNQVTIPASCSEELVKKKHVQSWACTFFFQGAGLTCKQREVNLEEVAGMNWSENVNKDFSENDS